MIRVLKADPTTRRRVISEAEAAALVGVSGNVLRESDFVAAYVVTTHFRVYHVNPMCGDILWLRCCPSLIALPGVPAIVYVFQKRSALPGVAAEAIAGGDQGGVVPVEPPPGRNADRTAIDAGL